MTAQAMDFNSDLGESYGWWVRGVDEVMMTCISSANVACGFHAGDATVMRTTVARALERGVAVGAHPGYPDLLGFGRRALDVTPADTRNYVLYQLGALNGFVLAAGARLRHVKPHGALYMATLDDERIARAVVEAVAEFDDSLPVFTLAGSEMSHAATKAGLQVVTEFFADRPLRGDGSVVMFGWADVFDATSETLSARVRDLLTTGQVQALDGTPVTVRASTVCVHSDTPGAELLGPAVRAVFDELSVPVQAPGKTGKKM
ncbi:MAG TPA: 5-oxoprolinase subunit PxpA [Streptosporangiaceae bacterium]|nr:5-oxoprolinase subunit PxpA [Streptosporangiaceae bacterium]